jgi:hypothetical protein
MPPYHTQKKLPAAEKIPLAVKHLGIITERCSYWWKKLPPYIKFHYDLEDMIGEAVVQICRNSRVYNSEITKESTWIWHVANNFGAGKVSHFYVKRYAGRNTRLSLIIPAEENEYSSRLKEAILTLEGIIKTSSEAICELISALLEDSFRTHVNKVNSKRYLEQDYDLVTQLREKFRRAGLTLDDFRLIQKYAIW